MEKMNLRYTFIWALSFPVNQGFIYFPGKSKAILRVPYAICSIRESELVKKYIIFIRPDKGRHRSYQAY